MQILSTLRLMPRREFVDWENPAVVNPQISWSFEPGVLLLVLALAALYVHGWRRARRPGEPHPPSVGRLLLFGAGLAAVLAALVSPIDGLGEQLMAMHMLQHILL